MVRKMVGSLRQYDTGHLTGDVLRDAIAGRTRITLPMAEPESLVLWDVDAGLRWTYRPPIPAPRQARYFDASIERARIRGTLLRALRADAAPRS